MEGIVNYIGKQSSEHTGEEHILYIATDEEGESLTLGECPGTVAEVLDHCAELSGEITVSCVMAREITRETLFTVRQS